MTHAVLTGGGADVTAPFDVPAPVHVVAHRFSGGRLPDVQSPAGARVLSTPPPVGAARSTSA